MTTLQTVKIPTFTLADRLRKARELTGLDQRNFAERTGITRTTVVNYEKGYRTPRIIYIRAWANATGVDVRWLETGEAPSVNEGDVGVHSEGFERRL